MRKTLLPLVLCLVWISFTNSVVQAQGTTSSSINGRIINDSGDALFGVSVIVRHEPTGTEKGVLSSESGYYRLPNLTIGGPYTITVNYVGYETQSLENIFLALGQTYRQDFLLSNKTVELEEVTITSAVGGVFDGNRTGAETYVSEREINSLPTVNRDFLQDFVRLDPRTSTTTRESGDGQGISIAGINNRFNAIYIDGAVNNDIFGLANSGTNGGQAGITPISPDAIEQIQVALAPYDVTYGGFAGAGINVVTKSGTNEFEGSAYYFLRNEQLAGRTPGDDAIFNDPDEDRVRLSDFTAETYGFRLGGPIIRDKLFFFVNAELQRDEVPTPFNFLTYQGEADEAQINELSNFVRNEFGFEPGGFLNNAQTREGEKVLAKLNWNINNNHKLTARYSYVRGEEQEPLRPNNQQIVFFNSGVLFPSTTHSSALELESVLGDNLFNDFIFGATVVRDDRDILGEPFPRIEAQDGLGRVVIGNEAFSFSNIVFQDVYTITNNLTLSLGRHNLTFGTHNELFKIQNLFTIFSVPTYFYNNSPDGATGVENFLGGAPAFYLFGHEQPSIPGDGAQVRFGDEALNLGPTFWAMQLSVYAQDEFDLTENLKLTYGLRLDLPVYLDDAPLDNTSFNEETVPLLEEEFDLEGARAGQTPDVNVLISPRVGFNWNVTGDNTTQIRGGAGLFASRVPWVWPGGLFIRNGLNSSVSAGVSPFFATPDEWRNNLLNLTSPSGDVDLFTENFRYPQVFRTSLAIDQRLPKNFTLTAEATYTKNIYNIDVKNVNLRPASGNLEGADDRPIFTQDPGNGSIGERIDPTYNTITLVDNTSKGYTFNGTLQLLRAFKDGITAQLGYSFTRSRVLFDGFGFINSTNWLENQSIQGRNNPEVTRSIFDAGHRVNAFFSKRWEFTQNFATTISIFYNGISGQPFSYVYANSEGLAPNRGLTNEANQSGRTLIFVPETSDQIVFADQATAAEQWAALDAYIEGNDYLSERRGQYVERNRDRTPFEHIFDVKFAQDISLEIGDRLHTLQFTIDIFNVNNLINSEWGQRFFVGDRGNFGLIQFEGFVEDTNTPTFSFETPASDPWSLIDSGFQSARWNAQIGIRYFF